MSRRSDPCCGPRSPAATWSPWSSTWLSGWPSPRTWRAPRAAAACRGTAPPDERVCRCGTTGWGEGVAS